jgi:hypothetical protein
MDGHDAHNAKVEFFWALQVSKMYKDLNKLVRDIDKEYNHGGEKVDIDKIMETRRIEENSVKRYYGETKARIGDIADRGVKVMELRAFVLDYGKDGYIMSGSHKETVPESEARGKRLVDNWNELNKLISPVDKILNDLINAVRAHHQLCGH